MKSSADAVTWKKRLKSFGERLGLASSSLLILAVILEIAVRVFSDIQPPITETDPVSGKHYRAHFDGELYVEEADAKVHIRINAAGFRGEDRPLAKPRGVRRIALLGDSFIAAIATKEEETTAVQLERMLNASGSGFRWEVMNFGISGASTGTELVTYREVARHYQPDIVLCAFYNGNDLADNSPKLSSATNRIYFELDSDRELVQMPFYDTRRKVARWLNQHSRLYIWQKHLFTRARNAWGGLRPGSWAFCSDPPDHVAESWELTEKLLLRFRDRVEEHGSRFAVVVIPNARQVYDDLWAEFSREAGDRCTLDREYPGTQLTRICSQGKVPLLRLLPSFRDSAPAHSSKKEDEWLFNMGIGHFNRVGNSLAAKEILRFLDREGLGAHAVGHDGERDGE